MGENVLQLLVYALLLGITLFLAAVPAILVGAWRQRPFPWKIFFLTLCLMAGYAAWIWGHPWVTCQKDLEKPVTQEQREKLRTFWAGFIPSGSPFWPTILWFGRMGRTGLRQQFPICGLVPSGSALTRRDCHPSQNR